MMADPAPTTSPTKQERDESVEAVNHLIQGKRHLLVQDYYSAVNSFQEACELFSKVYGETAKECGDAYLYYGKALLEVARQETGLLGNALEDEEEEEESEEDEEAEKPDSTGGKEESLENGDVGESSGKILEKVGLHDGGSGGDKSEEVAQKGLEMNEHVGKPNPDVSVKEEELNIKQDDVNSSGKGTDGEKEDTEEDLEKEEPALKEDAEPSAEAGCSSGAAKKEEEEVSNLQLSWEVLELAKVIFKKQAEENRDAYLKVAEVLLKLGEISIESDNYQQAVDDLSECLRIQQEMLEQDSRQLAETHYQLGLAYSFDNQYQDAAESFRNAMKVLELKIENNSRFVEEGKKKERVGSLDDDPVWLAEREIEELQSLLPEIKGKIEDAEDMMKQNCEAAKNAIIQKMTERLPATSPVKAPPGLEQSRPVNVITHLIKRKRQPDDGPESSADSKKAKSDAMNGESNVVGKMEAVASSSQTKTPAL